MVFPVVMYGCESWTVKKVEHRRIDAFELWCWRRLLRVPWTTRRSNQYIWKELSPYNEHSGFRISFRIDWFDLLAVHLLQHQNSKVSILWHSTFFMVQLSHPYMTIGKIIALTIWTFVGKVMSLLFNMLSRLVITFLPRSTRLLLSWLQSPSAVILEPKK